MDENKIILTDENGDKIEFTVIEETKLGDVSYLLVADEYEEACILKDVSASEDKEAVYEFASDDEFDAIADIFRELLDDYDLI